MQITISISTESVNWRVVGTWLGRAATAAVVGTAGLFAWGQARMAWERAQPDPRTAAEIAESLATYDKFFEEYDRRAAKR